MKIVEGNLDNNAFNIWPTRFSLQIKTHSLWTGSDVNGHNVRQHIDRQNGYIHGFSPNICAH